jgi:hypothetical protein
MNREDASAVVEADPRVDRRAIEQAAAQRRAAVVGGNARRENQPHTPIGLHQRERALEEQLVAVRMSCALVQVGVRRSAEAQRGGRHRSRIAAID